MTNTQEQLYTAYHERVKGNKSLSEAREKMAQQMTKFHDYPENTRSILINMVIPDLLRAKVGDVSYDIFDDVWKVWSE